MSDPIKFAESAASYNNRLAIKQREIDAMVAERETLIETSRQSGVLTGHARKMLAKLNYSITWPEGFRQIDADPTPQPNGHGEQIPVVGKV